MLRPMLSNRPMFAYDSGQPIGSLLRGFLPPNSANLILIQAAAPSPFVHMIERVACN